MTIVNSNNNFSNIFDSRQNSVFNKKVELNINRVPKKNSKINIEYYSLRTRLRAICYLAISEFGPTTRKHLRALGFSKCTISNFIREGKIDNIVHEEAFLLSIKSIHKEKIISHLLTHTYISSWYNTYFGLDERPSLIRIVGS